MASRDSAKFVNLQFNISAYSAISNLNMPSSISDLYFKGYNNTFIVDFNLNEVEGLDTTTKFYGDYFNQFTDPSGFPATNANTEFRPFIETKAGRKVGFSIIKNKVGSDLFLMLCWVGWNLNPSFPNRWNAFTRNAVLITGNIAEAFNQLPISFTLYAWGPDSPDIQKHSGGFIITFNNSTQFSTNANLGEIRNGSVGLFELGDYTKEIPDVPPGPPNPYEPGGPSGPDGGGGSFDDSSDQIVDSSIPTISSANTGFTRIYNPSLSQVQALARYLWTDENVIQTIWNHIKQYFEDPMQAIIGFNLVPVPVPNGGTQSFALMYIDTGVEMTVAASQFVDVDCGTFELKEYYGSALDYAPNTKVSCFLPFIGTVSLNTDEVMGRTLQVKYRVDICSGSCVAKIAVDGNFIYQYSGHCAINIPISSADFSSYVSSVISVAQLAAGAIAAGAGGVMASTAVDATQQTNQVVKTTQITNTARNPVTGRQITTGTMTRVETRESPNDQSSTQASFSGLTPQNISNTVGQIMSSKPNINHSGSFSGNSGYLGVRRPFLIIERPNMCMPSNFQALNGFPSMITIELSSCKGFTRVQQVQLTGFNATNPEQAEILQLLKSGVIL